MQIWSYIELICYHSPMHMLRFNFCLGSNFFQLAQLFVHFLRTSLFFLANFL